MAWSERWAEYLKIGREKPIVLAGSICMSNVISMRLLADIVQDSVPDP